jgi:hypothetical protein
MLDGIVTHPASSAIIPSPKTPLLVFTLVSSLFGASILACCESLGNGQGLQDLASQRQPEGKTLFPLKMLKAFLPSVGNNSVR